MASWSSRRLSFSPRLADLIPPPRKHRHRYHGVFAPNHKLRRAVTALAIGNVGKRQDATTGGHGGDGHGTEGCCDANPNQKPRSHDTSRIAWAKLMARVGEEFPLECPACGGDIRLIAFRLLSECETIPGLRTLGNLRLLRTSCPRARADPEDPHASWRTARAGTNRSRAEPSDRLGRARSGPGRPRLFQASSDEVPLAGLSTIHSEADDEEQQPGLAGLDAARPCPGSLKNDPKTGGISLTTARRLEPSAWRAASKASSPPGGDRSTRSTRGNHRSRRRSE